MALASSVAPRVVMVGGDSARSRAPLREASRKRHGPWLRLYYIGSDRIERIRSDGPQISAC